MKRVFWAVFLAILLGAGGVGVGGLDAGGAVGANSNLVSGGVDIGANNANAGENKNNAGAVASANSANVGANAAAGKNNVGANAAASENAGENFTNPHINFANVTGANNARVVAKRATNSLKISLQTSVNFHPEAIAQIYAKISAAATRAAAVSSSRAPRIFGVSAAAAAPLKIATFNAENLFDATAQGSEYRDFSPPKCPKFFGAAECKTRRAKWLADDRARYERRLGEVAAVLRGIGADVVALQEIENEGVLREVARRTGYEFWHFAAGKNAPVGLGFLAKIPLKNPRATAVAGVKTRPVLRVDVAGEGGTLTLINVHLPANSNGAKKRKAAAQTALGVARAAGSGAAAGANSNLAGADGGANSGWFGWVFGSDDGGENGAGGAGGAGGKNAANFAPKNAKNAVTNPASVIILGDFNSRYILRKFSGKKDDFLFLPQVQSGEFFSLWEDARAPYNTRSKGSHKNGKIDNALLSRAAAARYVRGSFAVVENAASDHAALVFWVR